MWTNAADSSVTPRARPSAKQSATESVVNDGRVAKRSNGSPDSLRLGQFIGMQIRERRQYLGMKITELAQACKISVSNLSKIETGQVSPSLQSLEAISGGLSTPIHTLFEGFDDEGMIYHVPRGKGMVVARPGKSTGHVHELLVNNVGQVNVFEPFLISLDEAGDQRATFTNQGMELVYVLSGSLLYRYGTRVLELHDGDTLVFDARTPHGPERILEGPSQILAIIVKGDARSA
jgi:transcriptional regulator with XRE-family HTH domain